jgi:phosphohistidine phosphatase
MDVCLVRHAIAEDRDPARWPDDARRPLTPEGAERFRRAARGLHRLVPEVDAVLTSPYVRAAQTAEILREESGWPEAERCDALAAVASPADVLPHLRGKAGAAAVALVGHEPFLSLLASLLLTGADERLALELKKGGVVLLAFPGEPSPGAASLRWSAPPRLLRAFDRGRG